MGVTTNLLLHQFNLLYALEIITISGINNKYTGCKSYLICYTLHSDYKILKGTYKQISMQYQNKVIK